MTTRRAWLLGLVAGLLVAAAAFFLTRTQPEAETTAPAAETAASRAGISEASTSREQPQDDRPTSAAGTAPPAGLAGLVALADAGDRQAACQVGYELLRCAHRQSRREAVMLAMLAERERTLEAEGDLAAANRLAVGYRDDMGTSNSVIPDDPYRAAVYYLLSARLFGTAEHQDWLDPLDAEQVQGARLEAGRLHAGVFEGRLHPRSDLYPRLPMSYQPNRFPSPCGPSS